MPNTPPGVNIAEPYSPCLATTTCGPMASTLRAARTRLGSSVSWRTSPSLRITQSTIEIVFSSDSWAMSIHRFIESSALKWLATHCSRTARCRSGWMLARKSVSAAREASESLGWKCSKTLRSVCRVWRRLTSRSYRPAQKNVLPPGTCSMSSVITPRERSTSYSASPKSSPTGPTTRVSAKKDEASEKWTAEPPSRRSRDPCRVSTASKAMDPTTVSVIRPVRLAFASVRAIRIAQWGGPEVLEYVEDADEPVAGDGELLVRVSRAGVNFADTPAREDVYVDRYALPMIPGAEVAGTVEGAGRRVVALTGGTGGY